MESTQSATTICLLGRFEIVDGRGKLRSRSSETLLAYLCLRTGKDVSRIDLADLVWPDSDGDRQQQNLRKAISDIRGVIESDPKSPAVLFSSIDRIGLTAESVSSDVAAFSQHAERGLAEIDAYSNLRQAIELYQGPLLPGVESAWVRVHRSELEEKFGQAVQALLTLLLQESRHDEALRVGRKAVMAAPLREDIHIALIRAYASAGMQAEAIRQFEELEELLDEHWGEPPSRHAVEALEVVQSQISPKPTTGVIDFYVTRSSDQKAMAALGARESTILIHGPRQVGKTKLLGRMLQQVRREGAQVVTTDFQVFNATQLETPDRLYMALAAGLMLQLGQRIDLAANWQDWLGPNANFEVLVEELLKSCPGRVVWAMDEVDRVFGLDHSDDFFGLLRSWHNRHTLEPDSPWSKLSFVIAYATEASLFIKNIHQSPFNVGVKVSLKDFTRGEVATLANRYQSDAAEQLIQVVWDLAHGHPFMTRRALDFVIHGGASLAQLQSESLDPDGPFGDHLSRLAFVIRQDSEVTEQVEHLLHGRHVQNAHLRSRLVAGGVAKPTDAGLVFRTPVYEQFLKSLFGGPNQGN